MTVSDSTLGYPGEGPPGVGCECCPLGPARRVQAKRPWAMDACGFCARRAQRNKWGYRCLECCTFWCDANRDRHALTHRCRCRRQDREAQADPTQETEAEDAVLPPLPPPPLPPLEPDATPLDEPDTLRRWCHRLMSECQTWTRKRLGMQDAIGPVYSDGAPGAHTTEGALLLRALACPATETMIRIPGKAADRVAAVLRDALRRAVDSQLAYVKKPTVAGRAEAAKAHRCLWVLPTLLLRVPPSDEQANETMKAAQCQKKRNHRHRPC